MRSRKLITARPTAPLALICAFGSLSGCLDAGPPEIPSTGAEGAGEAGRTAGAPRSPAPGQPEVAYLATPEQQTLDLPFSEAVRVGNMLYLSGQIGTRPGTTELVEGGIRAETRQTMENIRSVLERYGSSLDRVVKCTVMIDDMEQWPAMNEVYVEYFPERKPARSAVGADGLALGALVEIECWGTVG